MGGTFDPIHHGHLVTAEEALWQFDLDEVVFVPTGQPWMKADREVTPAEDRYLMTVIATSSNPRFRCPGSRSTARARRTRVDTLRDIGADGGDVELFFITGADAMLEIFQWKDPEEVLALAHFIAATRPGYDLARFERGLPRRPERVGMDIPALAISSTDIRRRVARGGARSGTWCPRACRPTSRRRVCTGPGEGDCAVAARVRSVGAVGTGGTERTSGVTAGR